MYYVYILVCSDKKHMKIGISGSDLSRLLTNHKNYNILINSSRFIPLTEKRLAYKVEQFLLGKIPKLPRDVTSLDGYTELRELKWAKHIKNYIQEIKTDVKFSYIDTKRMVYRLYTAQELVDKLKSNPKIDSNKIDKQYESLKVSSKGYVTDRVYRRVTKKSDYCTHIYYEEVK
jgi:hypothetical protein